MRSSLALLAAALLLPVALPAAGADPLADYVNGVSYSVRRAVEDQEDVVSDAAPILLGAIGTTGQLLLEFTEVLGAPPTEALLPDTCEANGLSVCRTFLVDGEGAALGLDLAFGDASGERLGLDASLGWEDGLERGLTSAGLGVEHRLDPLVLTGADLAYEDDAIGGGLVHDACPLEATGPDDPVPCRIEERFE
jgi:hypothetical protein